MVNGNGFLPYERSVLEGLNSPKKIQDFLDCVKYPRSKSYRSPRSVLDQRRADCLDAAVFGAAALRFNGERPLIMYMHANGEDWDHAITLFKRKNLWGAISKSTNNLLNFREPIHRDLRELMVSYFEGYFDLEGKKTLRGYSSPVNLSRFDDLHWETNDHALSEIHKYIRHSRIYSYFMTDGMANGLRKATRRMQKACYLQK